MDVNGITLEYERRGSGEPLLLVMGLAAQLTAWPDDFVAGLVGRGFDVIRFDNRDAGHSSECDWEPPSPIESFLRKLFRRPIETGYRAISPDRTAYLEMLRTPTLVIHGLVDPLVRPSGGIATAKAVPGSRLLMFPDMGHDLPAPRLDEMVEAIAANAQRAG